jgi:hypothetical protein
LLIASRKPEEQDKTDGIDHPMSLSVPSLCCALGCASALFATRALSADIGARGAARIASALPTLPLEPVYRVKVIDGKERFVTAAELDFKQLSLEGVAFFAVITNAWPTGLVPIFIVEKTNRFELRRRSVRGQENYFEPLFFALPPADEPHATKIAGHWEGQAVRGNGDKDFPAWELAIEGEQISGRFDQASQYRYAYLAGGTFRSNHVELRAEYNNDAYLLNGQWQDGQIKGTWYHVDGLERGTWQASRRENRVPSGEFSIALFEWRRISDGARRYAVESETLPPEWERSAQSLCRVWRQPIGHKE